MNQENVGKYLSMYVLVLVNVVQSHFTSFFIFTLSCHAQKGSYLVVPHGILDTNGSRQQYVAMAEARQNIAMMMYTEDENKSIQ